MSYSCTVYVYSLLLEWLVVWALVTRSLREWLFLLYPGRGTIARRLGHRRTMTLDAGSFHIIPRYHQPLPYQPRILVMFDCLKSSSQNPWTRNSFPGGKSHSPYMLFGPVLPSPYAGAAALPAVTIPASTPMIFPMQVSAPVQTTPVPVAVQQPSPVVQVLPPPVIQVTPSPVVPALPQTYTIFQTPQPVPHVPSPVIQSSIPVPQPHVVQSICHDHYRDQQQQGSPGKYTVNLYVNTPEHQPRQLDDRSPSPTLSPQLWEQQQQWQQQQQQQLQQRGRPQSARPSTAQPPTPSSLNISIFGPQPKHAQSGLIYLQTPTPPPR